MAGRIAYATAVLSQQGASAKQMGLWVPHAVSDREVVYEIPLQLENHAQLTSSVS